MLSEVTRLREESVSAGEQLQSAMSSLGIVTEENVSLTDQIER